MTRELCIVHANCQGDPLIERLMACPQFADRYECRLFVNYVREPIPDEAIGKCSLFLYQILGSSWGALASETLRAKLPQGAAALCIPNMFFKGYWPTWSSKPGIDYRCTHLDSYIDLGLPPEETVMLILRSDVAKKYDLLSLVDQTIKQERGRQAHTPVNYLELLIESYRERRLFNTVNHPGAMLMNHVASGLLSHLGFDVPAPEVFEALGEPFPEFEQPINPKVGEFFGWDFATPETQYNIYGRKMTYARYVANYVMARQKGISDFIGYLQGEYVDIG